MPQLLFSEKQKLADLIHANYKLLLVLSHFGIKLGFGDKNVEEVCKQYNISPALFLLICNVYTFETYSPNEKETISFQINDLTQYLKNSHAYYIKDRIPAIQLQLNNLANNKDPKQGDILKNFFEDYRQEIYNHLNYEENVVFPYIKDLQKGFKTTKYTIEQFKENHSNIEDKLNDLKNIIIKYLPDSSQENICNDLLFNLFLLEEDLNRHTLFENKILVPFVQQLEKRLL